MARYIKKQTIEELSKFIDSFLTKNSDIVSNIQTAIICLEECVGASKLIKDLDKYFFHYSIENVIIDMDLKEKSDKKYFYDDFSLLGYHEINGKVFYGLLGGCDYTLPVYFILYQDDKGILRGYIPTKGNTINPYGAGILGAYTTNDIKFARDFGYNDLREMEEALYPFFNENLLLEEIDKRLKLK